MVFWGRSEADGGMEIAGRVAAEYPEITTKFVTSGEPWAANAKVCSLAAMAKVATHDLWVISDSDVGVGRDYLRGVVCAFGGAGGGWGKGVYRGGVGESGVWSRRWRVGVGGGVSSGGGAGGS